MESCIYCNYKKREEELAHGLCCDCYENGQLSVNELRTKRDELLSKITEVDKCINNKV